MEKKRISLKEIGLTKLVILLVGGILIILLSFPSIFNKSSDEDNLKQGNTQESQHITKAYQQNTQVGQNDTNTTSYDANTYIAEMENKLESILGKVSGIGEVDVMITLKASTEQVPLKDSPSTQESLNEVDGEGGSRTDSSVKREESTVLVTNEDGNSVPYIIQELEPKIEGVVVIAEGGDDASIKMDIMEAAQVLFNVPAHKVKVMKMNHGIK